MSVPDNFPPPAPDQRHPLPGFSIERMPAFRLIVRHMPWGLWAPYQVTPLYAATMGVEGTSLSATEAQALLKVPT